MRRKRVVKVEVREIMPGCKRLSRAVTWSHFYFSRIPVVTVTRKEIWVGRAYCSHSGNRWWCPGVGWEQWSWWEVVREWKHCEGRNKRISWWIERAVGKQASTTGRVALPYPEMHKTGRKWKVCVKFVMLPRNSGEGGGNPLQYFCLGNRMDRGAWWATVHGAAKSWTWLRDWAHRALSMIGTDW